MTNIMKHSKTNIISLIGGMIILTLSLNSHAVTTASTSLSTDATTPRYPQMKCVQYKISTATSSGTDTTTTLNSTSTNIPFGGISCGSEFVYGVVVSIVGVTGWSYGSGTSYPSKCPDDQPYMTKVVEQWGGVLGAAAGGNMRITCCSAPNPEMSVVSDHSTWTTNTSTGAPSCP